ncbi:MAG: hypothetical protein H5T44_01425 [Thermoplasmatales archaeon]|nr:hypothetical protein [Thermoplasmatales archaeon]
MKKIALATIILICTAISYSAFGWGNEIKPIWYKTWGSGEDDFATCIDVVNDSIYVGGASNGKGVLLKYDIDGKAIWNVTFDDSTINDLKFYNGYIYLTGKIREENKDVFIAKLDENKSILWMKKWGGSGDDIAYGLDVYENNIYICGVTSSFGAISKRVLLLKYDNDGNLLWAKTWGGNKDEEAYDIYVTNGIYITGYTTTYSVGEKDAILLKFDIDGNLLFFKTWGGEKDDIGYSIDISDGIYIAGYTSSYFPSSFVIKYDMNGELIFDRRWGGENDCAFSVKIYGDSFYAGGINSEGDLYLVKYRDDNFAWLKTWGGKKEDCLMAMDIENERIYIAGYTESYSQGGKDILILKCNLEGKKSMEVITFSDKINIFGREIIPFISCKDFQPAPLDIL